jgi:hypothetical protein
MNTSLYSGDDYSGDDYSGDDYSGNYSGNYSGQTDCLENCEDIDELSTGIIIIIFVASLVILCLCYLCCDYCLCDICYCPYRCIKDIYGTCKLYKEQKKIKNINKNSINRYLNKLENNIGFDNNCVICFDQLKKGKNTIKLPCNHSFHKNCIHTWLKSDSNHTCPVCRTICSIDKPLVKPVKSVIVINYYSSDEYSDYDDY